jgi:hypothetical protein
MDPATSYTLSKASRNTLITTSVIGKHHWRDVEPGREEQYTDFYQAALLLLRS